MTNTLTATLRTNQGTIVVRLFPDHAPKTVRNFVELAEGTRDWTDPRTRKPSRESLYNGTIFHRVIPDFMIQGGDPLGTGTGGPGYQFGDEIHPDLSFSRPYLLAMANAGPGTNGSQFFITTVPTPWLNGKHTIFGEVIEGSDVVDAISHVDRDRRDRPAKDVVLESVEITGPAATRRDPRARPVTQAEHVDDSSRRRAPRRPHRFRPASGTRAGRPTCPAAGAGARPARTACGPRRSASSAWNASRRATAGSGAPTAVFGGRPSSRARRDLGHRRPQRPVLPGRAGSTRGSPTTGP